MYWQFKKKKIYDVIYDVGYWYWSSKWNIKSQLIIFQKYNYRKPRAKFSIQKSFTNNLHLSFLFHKRKASPVLSMNKADSQNGSRERCNDYFWKWPVTEIPAVDWDWSCSVFSIAKPYMKLWLQCTYVGLYLRMCVDSTHGELDRWLKAFPKAINKSAVVQTSKLIINNYFS